MLPSTSQHGCCRDEEEFSEHESLCEDMDTETANLMNGSEDNDSMDVDAHANDMDHQAKQRLDIINGRLFLIKRRLNEVLNPLRSWQDIVATIKTWLQEDSADAQNIVFLDILVAEFLRRPPWMVLGHDAP